MYPEACLVYSSGEKVFRSWVSLLQLGMNMAQMMVMDRDEIVICTTYSENPLAA